MTAAIRNCAFALAAVLTLTNLSVGPAFAGPAEDAAEAFAAEQKGDFPTALRLYRTAALAGNTYAQGNLGTMYHTGKGGPKNFTEALRWYTEAAKANYADSQFNLGIMNELGEGMKQDFAAAAKWYRLAAEQGYVPAQTALGTLTAAGGPGVTPDRGEAYKWFVIAAAKGDDQAKKRMAAIAGRLTPEQKAKAEKDAADFKPKEAAKK
ncbi:MAG: sel1 repeat family protein [Rhodospirillaceae bacterium]|nr:sel1 repeat family protein [Rhodospirillaceae bacterium]